MTLYEPSRAAVFLLLLVAFIIPAVLFIYYQQKTLVLVRLENRKLNPVKVWLQLIPVFGLVWQFIVVRKIADSIYQELSAAPEDGSLFQEQQGVKRWPTYSMGLNYCAFLTASLIPVPSLKFMFSLAGLVSWIIYWIQLVKFNRLLKQKALLRGSLN